MSDSATDALFAVLKDQAARYKDVNAQLAASTVNKPKWVKDFVQNSEDPAAVKLRTAIETAHAKLTALANSQFESVSSTLDDEAQAKLTKESKELRRSIKEGSNLILDIARKLGRDVEAHQAKLNELELPTQAKSSSGGGSAAGTPKPRVTVTVDGTDHDNLTKAALANKFNATKLRAAWANAAGVEVSQVSSVETPTRFEFEEHTVVVTPKKKVTDS